MQHCAWCGEELGVYRSYPGDVQSCGAATCERELRAMDRAAAEERYERAAEDGFNAYGGGW